jgi:hypothetical protein
MRIMQEAGCTEVTTRLPAILSFPVAGESFSLKKFVWTV